MFPSRKFVTLLGPSGCGKTTLLRMIAGLEPVTSGHDPLRRPRGQRAGAARPQHRHGVPVLRALSADDGAAQPRLRPARAQDAQGRDRRGRRARRRAFSRSATCSTASPAQLSGGQRQRVALGRAMVRQPDIFLMDEPLSNLDAKLRVTMRAELRRFHLDLGATTIYVTHDQLEAMTMSDLIAVMHGGVVQQFGTPAEVYNRPANLFVAGFIGSPPMNFVTGDAGAAAIDRRSLRPSSRCRCRAPKVGQTAAQVVLGVRPQDLDAGRASRSPHPCAAGSGWWSCWARRSWWRSTLRRSPPHDGAGARRNGRECRRRGRRAGRSAARPSVRCQSGAALCCS